MLRQVFKLQKREYSVLENPNLDEEGLVATREGTGLFWTNLGIFFQI